MPRSCRRPGSTNDHDLGLFAIGGQRRAVRSGTRHGRALPPGLGDRHASGDEAAGGVPADNGALAGSSDHGTTKSLYGKDPDGLEFEIAWIVPADRLDDAAREARKRIGRLDLDQEIARYGADTRGGIGISVPIA